MGSLVVFSIGFAYMAPTAVAKFSSSQVYRIGPTGERTIAGLGWADRLVTFSDYTVVVVAVLALALSLVTGRTLRWSPAATPLIGIVALATVVSMIKLAAPPTGQPIMLILAISAASLIRTSKRAVANGASALVLSAVLLGTTLAVFKPEAALQKCSDKCTLVGEIFTGLSSHGNGLALLVSLSLPFVWLATERKTRFWLVLHMLFIVAISGSRTALAAALLVVFVLCVMRVRVSGDVVKGRGASFGILTAVGVALISLIVALIPHEDTYTTGRGYLWRIALEQISASPLVGTGLTTWSELFEDGLFGSAAAYSTHNQWMEVLLFSGILGAALLAWFTTSCLAEKGNRLALAPLLVAVFAVGVFERPFSISLVDSLTWAMLGIVMLAGTPSTPSEGATSLIRAEKPALPRWANIGNDEVPASGQLESRR